MGEVVPFMRTWRVTMQRGVVAAAPAVVLATILATSAPEGDRLSQFGDSLAALLTVPAVWLLVGGAWLDHKWAARGPGSVLAGHLGGSFVALVIVTVGGIVVDAITGREPLEVLSLMFALVATPLWFTVGFLFAWIVPGSFPSRSRRESAPAAN